MKDYIVQFKPFLVFLAKFLLSYFVLTLLYQSYLNQFDEKSFEVDGFTQIVANQSQKMLSIFTKKTQKIHFYFLIFCFFKNEKNGIVNFITKLHYKILKPL